jgi:hypothetical protein
MVQCPFDCLLFQSSGWSARPIHQMSSSSTTHVHQYPARAGRWVYGSWLEFKTTFASWVRAWGLEDWANFLSFVTAIGMTSMHPVLLQHHHDHMNMS